MGIYVCKYDCSFSFEVLEKYEKDLPLPSYDGPLEGVKWQKRRERLLAWLLFQKVIGSERMKALNIQRTESGKPYSAADPEFHFNISHCENACACIISDAPCGVDVEKKFAVRENLIRKICHPEEYTILEKLEEKEKERQLRFLWSMKESFVKMDGRGLGYGIETVNLASLLPVKAGELQSNAGTGYIAEEFETYTLAGCVQESMQMPVHIIAEAELLGKM